MVNNELRFIVRNKEKGEGMQPKSTQALLLFLYFALNRNRFGETPVDSAFRSGKKELVDLLDKEQLLPRDKDPKLPSSITKVRNLVRLHKVIFLFLILQVT